jgi:hypothetical protein
MTMSKQIGVFLVAVSVSLCGWRIRLLLGVGASYQSETGSL